jgi:hypothetical protein
LKYILGTTRRQVNWPPKEYKRVKDKRFNTVYRMVDVRNFVILRWIENCVVNLISIVHDGYEVVYTERKPPRQSPVNRLHVRKVW